MIAPFVIGAVVLLALLSHKSGAAPDEGRMDTRPATAGRSRIFAILDRLAEARPSLPRWLIYAMADRESGFSSRAYAGGREDSLGIFQINWNAHGATLTARGIRRESLYDPSINATYWGEVADRLRQAAIARGFTPPGLWYAMRLRLVGILWENFDTPKARQVVRDFRPFVAKWQGRMA